MQEILLPSAKADADPSYSGLDAEDTSLPPELEFDAVPRHAKRSNGLTPERQRIFIRLLAECGSVGKACKAIGCSSYAMYHLRNSEEAEGFAAAWDKAVQRGARRVLDILIDQAINGTPEKIYKDGQLVAERRRFNTRSMMWIVAHYMPERFGVSGGLMHASSGPVGMKRLKDAWKREWRAEMEQNRVCPEAAMANLIAKVAAVRKARLGNYGEDPAKVAAYELLYGKPYGGEEG